MENRNRVLDINAVARVVRDHRLFAEAYVEVKSIIREMSEKGLVDLQIDAKPCHAHLNRIAGFNSFFPNTVNNWWVKFRPFEAYPQGDKTLIKFRSAYPCDIWRKVDGMDNKLGDLESRVKRLEHILKDRPEALAYDRKVLREQLTEANIRSGMSTRQAKKAAWREAGETII